MEQAREKRCPACGGALECKLTDLSIGADGGGGLLSLLADTYYDVDLYACPQCGKVELYTAHFRPKGEPEEDETVTCPVCGKTHSSLIGCPSCAMNANPTAMSFDRAPRKKKERKPPWER